MNASRDTGTCVCTCVPVTSRPVATVLVLYLGMEMRRSWGQHVNPKAAARRQVVSAFGTEKEADEFEDFFLLVTENVLSPVTGDGPSSPVGGSR
jgi:hypothetical protein